MTTNQPAGDQPHDESADGRIDSIARRAGRELRRPAPEQGIARVMRARRNRQITRATAGSVAVIALLVGGFVVANGLGDDDTVSTVDPVDTHDTVARPATTTAPAVTEAPGTSEVESSVPTASVPAPSTPATVGADVLAIPNQCDEVTGVCTQLLNTEDGRIVALDPNEGTLGIYDSLGSQLLDEVEVDEPIAEELADLVFVGQDDVVYIQYHTPGLSDPGNDLVAIALSGPNAGTTIQRWTGLDGSGDSSLVPRRSGLAVVNCCGLKDVRPDPDAEFYPFVNSTGAALDTQAPTFEIALGATGNELRRTNLDGGTTSFQLPTAFQYPRDMPRLVGTDDGGALGYDYVDGFGFGVEVFVRFGADWDEIGFDNSDVYVTDGSQSGVILLETSGTVVVAEGDVFVRRNLDEIATPGWDGDVIYDLSTGAVSTLGLNDAIDERQPIWAQDPHLLALQIVPVLTPGASVQTDFDESTGTLTVTTTGVQYDGTSTERVLVTTERADNGLLHVVEATYAWQCQPGSGHQDFSVEPCN